MAMPLQSFTPRSVGDWLNVPQTQREGIESLGYLSRRRLVLFPDHKINLATLKAQLEDVLLT